MPNPDDQHHAKFLRLFAEHEAALHTLLRAMLPSREDASEALQETIVVLWQKFGEFDPTRDFKNWACGIARNKALALLRDRKRDRHIFDDELVNRLADETLAMEQRHFTQREALDACLQKLSAGECNGVLYACIGSNGVAGDNIGGIFYREDGPVPQWKFVYEWPVNDKNPDIRGFTAVPHPKGFAYDVALVTLESFGMASQSTRTAGYSSATARTRVSRSSMREENSSTSGKARKLAARTGWQWRRTAMYSSSTAATLH